jgi:hypothetical protein
VARTWRRGRLATAAGPPELTAWAGVESDSPGGAAISELLAADVGVRLRKPPSAGAGRRELDLWLEPRDRHRADVLLERSGFHHLRLLGYAPHRFYVTFRDGLWHKIDVKLAHRSRAPEVLRQLSRHLPAGVRRHGPVVAVVGADPEVRRRAIADLSGNIPLRVYVARFSGPAADERDGGRVVRRTGFLEGLRLARAFGEAWSGTPVLCDGYPPGADDADPRASLIGRLLQRFLPSPDRWVVLSASGGPAAAGEAEQLSRIRSQLGAQVFAALRSRTRAGTVVPRHRLVPH